MSKFINNNSTRYNTEDLDDLFGSFYNYVKSGAPGLMGKKWEKLKWKVGSEDLPFNVSTWTPSRREDITATRRFRTYGPLSWSVEQRNIPGPYYCDKPRKNRAVAGIGLRHLRILPPATVDTLVSPLEALAITGEERRLPEAAVVQILFQATQFMGISLYPSHHQTGHFIKGDTAVLIDLVTAFIAADNRRVRVEKRVQSPTKNSLTSEQEKIDNLLIAYRRGGSALFMNHKLWSLRNNADDYFDSWSKVQQHYRQLKKKGVEVESYDTPAELLRKIADDLELREQQLDKKV